MRKPLRQVLGYTSRLYLVLENPESIPFEHNVFEGVLASPFMEILL